MFCRKRQLFFEQTNRIFQLLFCLSVLVGSPGRVVYLFNLNETKDSVIEYCAIASLYLVIIEKQTLVDGQKMYLLLSRILYCEMNNTFWFRLNLTSLFVGVVDVKFNFH